MQQPREWIRNSTVLGYYAREEISPRCHHLIDAVFSLDSGPSSYAHLLPEEPSPEPFLALIDQLDSLTYAGDIQSVPLATMAETTIICHRLTQYGLLSVSVYDWDSFLGYSENSDKRYLLCLTIAGLDLRTQVESSHIGYLDFLKEITRMLKPSFLRFGEGLEKFIRASIARFEGIEKNLDDYIDYVSVMRRSEIPDSFDTSKAYACTDIGEMKFLRLWDQGPDDGYHDAYREICKSLNKHCLWDIPQFQSLNPNRTGPLKVLQDLSPYHQEHAERWRRDRDADALEALMNLFCHAGMMAIDLVWTYAEIEGILGPADVIEGTSCHYVAKDDSLSWYIGWEDSEKRERMVEWRSSN